MLHRAPIGNRQLAIGNASACVLNCLAALFEHFAVPDEASARVSCQFEILRQFQARRRTRFLTKSTEHAARRVEDKLVEHFLASWLAGNDDLDVHRKHVDAVFRAGDRA